MAEMTHLNIEMVKFRMDELGLARFAASMLHEADRCGVAKVIKGHMLVTLETHTNLPNMYRLIVRA